jgi:P27 family predicted phage terminase small subunit
MGLRGPVPTPTKILQARGSRLAASREGEVQYPEGAPRCPAWLPAAAKREWKRIVPMLEGAGVLSQADLGPLACYCVAISELEEATRLIAAEGRSIAMGKQTQPHPAVAQQRSAWQAVKVFSAMFGFSPADRARVKGPGPKAEEPSGKARFFGGA